MCIPSDSAVRKAPKLPEHSGPQIRDYRRQLRATNLVLTPLESLGTRARQGFPWAGVLSNCISLVNSGFSRFGGNLQKQAIAQACAFSSPFFGDLSAIEILQQSFGCIEKCPDCQCYARVQATVD